MSGNGNSGGEVVTTTERPNLYGVYRELHPAAKEQMHTLARMQRESMETAT